MRLLKSLRGLPESLRRRLGPWRVVISATVLIVVGGLILYGLHVHRCRLADDKVYHVRSSSLRLVELSPWMTPEIGDEIHASLDALPPTLSVMDPRSAGLVAECLESNPWIRKVYYVRLDRPQSSGGTSGIEVSMAFRRPVAFVEMGSGPAARYYLVDREGIRLGDRVYEDPQLGDRVLLTISGAAAEPPRPGRAWPDAGVLAAADVADLLRRHAVKFNLSRISVSRVAAEQGGGRPEITLYTRHCRTRILWGGLRDRRTETLEGWTASQKLRCLDRLYETLGGLDGRVEEVNLVERQLRRCRPDGHRAQQAVRS